MIPAGHVLWGLRQPYEDAVWFHEPPSEQGSYTQTQQRAVRTEKGHEQIVFLEG